MHAVPERMVISKRMVLWEMSQFLNIPVLKLFQEKGKKTPVFVRFSSVIHGGHSPETLRDPRGFAVKFYTEDGNWDLVGNNLKIFFIRDAIKFPDMIHAFKPDPVTNIQDSERFFDFCASSPEVISYGDFRLFSMGHSGKLPNDARVRCKYV